MCGCRCWCYFLLHYFAFSLVVSDVATIKGWTQSSKQEAARNNLDCARDVTSTIACLPIWLLLLLMSFHLIIVPACSHSCSAVDMVWEKKRKVHKTVLSTFVRWFLFCCTMRVHFQSYTWEMCMQKHMDRMWPHQKKFKLDRVLRAGTGAEG